MVNNLTLHHNPRCAAIRNEFAFSGLAIADAVGVYLVDTQLTGIVPDTIYVHSSRIFELLNQVEIIDPTAANVFARLKNEEREKENSDLHGRLEQMLISGIHVRITNEATETTDIPSLMDGTEITVREAKGSDDVTLFTMKNNKSIELP